MTIKFYAVERKDGGVSIMQTSEDPQSCINQWSEADRAAVVAVRPIKKASIPADRTFRNAWTADLQVDMAKARDIWRDRMREARTPKLAGLDLEQVRAGPDANKWREIEDKKQPLRDVTADPAIEAAKTPDELKKVWPAILS